MQPGGGRRFAARSARRLGCLSGTSRSGCESGALFGGEVAGKTQEGGAGDPVEAEVGAVREVEPTEPTAHEGVAERGGGFNADMGRTEDGQTEAGRITVDTGHHLDGACR